MLAGMRVVDGHCHVAPTRLAMAVRRALAEMYGWDLHWPVEPDEVLAALRAAGVDRMAVMPYAHAPGIAHSLNKHACALARDHPDVIPMATVHPDDDDPPALLAEALADGARGLKVHCPVQRTRPDDPRMRRVYALCETEDVPVLMHAGHSPDASTPYGGAAPFSTLVERHPRLRVCVAHLGMPETAAFLAILDRHPTMWLDLAAVAGDQRSPGIDWAPLLERADRVIWGSDFPNTRVSPADSLAAVRRAGFEGTALQAVLAGNAERFLRLSA